MCAICSRFDVSMLVNVVEGGRAPVLSAGDYAEIGFESAIFPGTGFMATVPQ